MYQEEKIVLVRKKLDSNTEWAEWVRKINDKKSKKNIEAKNKAVDVAQGQMSPSGRCQSPKETKTVLSYIQLIILHFISRKTYFVVKFCDFCFLVFSKFGYQHGD